MTNASHLYSMLGVTPGAGGRAFFTGRAMSPGALGALGDDSAVMMISGLGDGLGSSPLYIPPGMQLNPTWVAADACAMERANNPNTPLTGPCPQRVGPQFIPVPGSTGGATAPLTSAQLSATLQLRIKLFNIELPLWAWLGIAALLGGAGGFYLGRR